MKDADGCLQALVTQIGIKLLQISRHHQAFIDDGLMRKAADVVLCIYRISYRRTTAGDKQLDGEFLIIQPFTTNKNLLDLRQTLKCQASQH